ncbi:unknown [[Mannheimia] succiniciproducens MBEL55E]|uniref:Uncharacterized protein n=1 Tax=Mannheimia succiniciproducens (strain KCTC 0769BP / MBEL55E) TaxID=221988 RepID=Q65TM0_MANSM|nr:unknown [[Mannheimia] succiniciproducens MBEL55E]
MRSKISKFFTALCLYFKLKKIYKDMRYAFSHFCNFLQCFRFSFIQTK